MQVIKRSQWLERNFVITRSNKIIESNKISSKSVYMFRDRPEEDSRNSGSLDNDSPVVAVSIQGIYSDSNPAVSNQSLICIKIYVRMSSQC